MAENSTREVEGGGGEGGRGEGCSTLNFRNQILLRQLCISGSIRVFVCLKISAR